MIYIEQIAIYWTAQTADLHLLNVAQSNGILLATRSNNLM